MATVTLRNLCRDLLSLTRATRQTAFNDLQRFLNQDDASSQLADETTYENLLQSLIFNFKLELAGFRKSNTGVTSNMLHTSAESLRVSVEKADHLIARKTMLALVNHVLDSLPKLQPLENKEIAPSYFALLKNIASNPVYIEQMKQSVWRDVLQLCISNIKVGTWFDLSNGHPNQGGLPQENRTFVEHRSTIAMRKEVVDLMICLQSLCTFPAAPFQSDEGEDRKLLSFLLNFLVTYDSASDARMSAVIALNRLIAHISVNNVQLAAETSTIMVDIISQVWDARIAGFKDRLLVSISFLYPHLHKLVTHCGISATTRKHMDSLLNKLEQESRAQEHKSGLKLDDLLLSPLPHSSLLWTQRPFQSFFCPYFSLSPASPSAELAWLSLQIQSSFLTLLDLAPTGGGSSSDEDVDRHPKRQRLSPNPNLLCLLDTISQYKNNSTRSVVVFQKLAFYLNSFRQLPESIDFPEILGCLENHRGEDNGEVVGWSFVCMLGILGHSGKVQNTIAWTEQWKRIWITCSKQVALSVPCRAACAVMTAIMDKDILDARSLVPQIESIVEYVEHRGPGVFCDVSCEFWSSLLYKFEQIGIPTDTLRSKVLARWVRLRWDPIEGSDPILRRKILFSLGFPILRMFSSMYWSSTNLLDFTYAQSLPQSALRQSLTLSSSAMSLVNFLLDSAIEPAIQPLESTELLSHSKVAHQIDLNGILKEKCQEVESLLTPTQQASLNISHNLGWYMSLSMISMVLLGTLAGQLITDSVGPQDCRKLLTAIAVFVSKYSTKDILDSCLRSLSQFVRIADSQFREDQHMERSLQQRIQDIYGDPIFREIIDQLCQLSGSFSAEEHEEGEDVDFGVGRSAITSSASSLDDIWATRDISRSSMIQDGWRIRTLVQLHTEVHLRRNLKNSVISQGYFRTITPHNLLLAGDQVSKTIFAFDDATSQSAADHLLKTFKSDIASMYEWSGNEMTMNLAMAIISSYFAVRGRVDRASAVHNTVLKLYQWILKVVINRKLSSPNARLKAAELLRNVYAFDIHYGKESEEMPSAGMHLIHLIQDRDVRVKFSLATYIRSIFLLFPTSAKSVVYADILERLERNEAETEGFAIRAYTLTHLALASDDIRRAAMVNLLEIGRFANWQLTVRACFMHLAERQYQGQLAELFLQNSSQFIHSLIDFDEDISQFPFNVFGFPNFGAWATSVGEELVAQLAVANKWDAATKLFGESIRFDEVLATSLPRVVSYYYLVRGSTAEEYGVADQCQGLLGKEIYISILTQHFARSLAIIIEKFDDKTLSIDGLASLGLDTAATIFSNIRGDHPYPSQLSSALPFFDLARVCRAIDYLRQELNIVPQSVWSPANTIFVIRQLVTRGAGASDTTVALSFLRRIVLVICLASDSLSNGYPVEMLLLGLKEFIGRETLCRETLDVIKYVFSHGSKYFTKNPERLRDVVALMLPPIQHLPSAITEQQQIGIGSIYECLEGLVRDVVPTHPSLDATGQILAILSNGSPTNGSSVGQIIEAVIVDNEELWEGDELCHFALTLLSVKSNVLLEPLPTLQRLVMHFLKTDHIAQYSANSKIWLGFALGRVSNDGTYFQPEYQSTKQHYKSLNSDETSISNIEAILRETVNFMRSHPEIAGFLEQALRDMVSISPSKSLRELGKQQTITKYLRSPHIQANVSLQNHLFPPPSSLETWISFNPLFVDWHKDFGCSIAQHLPNQQYATLIPSIKASKAFCDKIFPFLVDEYRRQNDYDGSLSNVFNELLKSDTEVLGYSRLVIRTILFLRSRPRIANKGGSQPLLDETNYLLAASAAVDCKMLKTALMFLEIHGNSNHWPNEQLADQTLSSIYRNIDDPDLAYALSQDINRSWGGLLDVYKLHHDRDGVNRVRTARLRSKVELGDTPSVEDEDFCAVADLFRQNGVPLKLPGISSEVRSESHLTTSTLYASAWRLGCWDLPPITSSKDSDTLLYTVLYHLVWPKLTDEFSSVLESSTAHLVDYLRVDLSSTERSNAFLCLSMFADVKSLISGLQPLSAAAKRWALKITESARYGRHAFYLTFAYWIVTKRSNPKRHCTTRF
jgi:serine-protein kinase ATM